MLNEIQRCTDEYIFLNVDNEIFDSLCQYINICRELNIGLNRNDYIAWESYLREISNLMSEAYNRNNEFKYCELEIRCKLQEICERGITDLINRYDNINLREILNIIQCYRNSYLSVISKKLSHEELSQEKIVVRFLTDFFDKIQCICAEFWSNTTENEIGLGSHYDINKKVEEDLRRSENRYEILLELMPDAVVVHKDKNIQYCNKAFVKLLGYESKEEILQKPIYEVMNIQDKYKSIYQQRMDRVIREGTVPLAEEAFLRKKDSRVIEVETTCTLIPYKDDFAVMEIMRDISERKRIDELKKKVNEKTMLLREAVEYDKIRNEFFANISHELKTPVNVIFSAIQLIELYNLKSDNIKYNTHKYLSIMKQNCYRLIRIVNNLIDITKIDAGFYEIHMYNCDIVNVVENITLSVADYIEKQGIELIFDTDVEEKTIACDPDKIERIILNLLSNAIKFTKVGGHIYVDIKDKGDNVIITVKDTGIGIPKEKQNEVFNRFIQVDKSLSRNREGSGIGLSLVKSLVELHGGSIQLESQQGEGAKFIICLPVKILEEKNVHASEEPSNTYNNIERINIEFSDIYQ